MQNRPANTENTRFADFGNGAPGYSFRWVLESANATQIRAFLGDSLSDLLSRIDQEAGSESDVRKIAVQLLDPWVVLQTKSLRDLITSLLPIEKARELARKLELSGQGNVYEQLQSIGASPSLYSFFGATSPRIGAQSESIPSEARISASYGLYPHQRDIAARATATLKEPSSKVVIHMPTGSGKTRTAMHIVSETLRSRPETVVVWLAQSAELLEQAAEEFEKSWSHLGDREVSITRFWGDYNVDIRQATDGLFIAGLPKLNAIYSRDNRAVDALGDRASLIVFDEAHQIIAPTYQRLVDALFTRRRGTTLIGLTATPGRTWANIEDDEKLSDFFENKKVRLEVEGYDDPITYLIEEGYLARPYFRELTVNAVGESSGEDEDGEYNTEFLNILANNVDRNSNIIQAVKEAVSVHRRIIVFGATVQHASILTGALTRLGIESILITAKTDQRARETAIRRFKGNSPSPIVLCNYGVLTTGFDAPSTSCAIIARPTRSLVLYSQMVGRATRGPKVGGNEKADIITVIDTSLPGFGDLVEAFSNWEDVWND